VSAAQNVAHRLLLATVRSSVMGTGSPLSVRSAVERLRQQCGVANEEKKSVLIGLPFRVNGLVLRRQQPALIPGSLRALSQTPVPFASVVLPLSRSRLAGPRK
jgi:hypothetical protein